MNDLLANPMIQSGLIPFVVAFAAAWGLRRVNATVAGLAFALACAVAIHFIIGFQFTPLTSTRKLVLAGAGGVVLGLLADLLLRGHRLRPWLLAAIGAAAALWLVWPRVARLDGSALWLMLICAPAYAAWLLASVDSLNARPVNLVIAVLALGIGTAVCAVLGSSALLGQLGGVVAAAAGAYALLFILTGEFRPGGAFAVAAAALLALIAVSAIVFARQLPWHVLIPLALIPLLARLPVPAHYGVFARSLLVTLYTAPAAGVAIALAWRVTGSPSF